MARGLRAELPMEKKDKMKNLPEWSMSISGVLILSVETITHFLLSTYDVPNGTKPFPDLVTFNPVAALLVGFEVYQQ